MKTTIDNNLIVLQVITSTGKQFFCNISQLNYVVVSECKPGYFRINHFCNSKPARLTKKGLKNLFEGNQLTQEFEY